MKMIEPLRNGTRGVTRANGPVSRVRQEKIDRTLLMCEMEKRRHPFMLFLSRDTGHRPKYLADGYPAVHGISPRGAVPFERIRVR